MAAAASSSRKLRILALHGYTSNAFILQRRLGAIRKACKDYAEFVFVNGPIRVEPITDAAESLDAPDRVSKATDPTIPLEEQPRAWWRSSDEGVYLQFDETIEFLNKEFAQHGPFDGVFGFSQGACFAALIASAFEDPSRYPKFQLPKDQGPLKFCVAVSGFRSRDPNMQTLFPDQGIQTPILHILGKADQIVDEERAQTLVEASANSRVEHHESGHVIPSQAPWRNFLRDFFASFIREGEPADAWKTVIGPNSRPKGEHSEPNSGTVTPRQESERTGNTDKSSL